MILFLFIAFVFVGYLIKRRMKQMSVLARNGIPGPKPSLIYGNLLEYQSSPAIQKHKEWIQKYGKIMGYYSGAKPFVIVADLQLVKNIQIKDFNRFADRPQPRLKHGVNPLPEMSGSILRSKGNRWKQMRSILTPTFSASKLKTMTPIIDDSINTFLELIEEKSKSDVEFNIYDMFQGLTTDVIGRTAFGVRTNVQKDPNDKFLHAAKDIFNIKLNKWVFKFVLCFPIADPILYPFRRLIEIIKHMRGTSARSVLLNMVLSVINLRRNNPEYRRKDLLQLLLDTKLSNEEMSAMNEQQLTVNNDQNENISNGVQNTSSKSSKEYYNLTDDEIKANSVTFFEAGYETTSTTLGFLAHILVNYPEIQEKLREEVKQLYEKEGKLDYNAVKQLEYMEWVVNETMRLYPPIVAFVEREALIDYKYKDITIPKGATVTIAVYYLHHDSDHWEEPEKFDEMRFSPERRSQIHSSSWQPFGNGPRNCVGMRFALLEAKLALSKLLLKYRLERGPKTEIGDITLEHKHIAIAPKYGVFVKAIKI